MHKKTTIWLIIATSLLLIGGLIFAGVMAALGWDFTKLSTTKFETNTHTIKESYKNISVITDTADVILVPADNAESSVVCYEQEKVSHSVTVDGDTLVIRVKDTRKWYDHIGINFCSPKITITIPRGEYGELSVQSHTGDTEIPDALHFASMNITGNTGSVKNYASVSGTIKIKTDTGNIHTQNITADTLDLSVNTGSVTVSGAVCQGDIRIAVSTGKTSITDSRCKNVISDGDTGDINLKNVIATEKFSIKRSTGNVTFDNSDATEIFAQTDTGDIGGSLLTSKIYIVDNKTGKVIVPQSVSGGKCEINTDTGDIVFSSN